MSDDIIEYVAAHAGQSRRQFLVRLLATSAFAAPVIASFAIGGTASSARGPLGAGGVPDIDCGPNQMFDLDSNMCVDDFPNVVDDSPNVVDDGPNDQDSGGVGNDGGGIPSTR